MEGTENIRKVVRTLNSAFSKNFFYPKERIAPFKGVMTKERGWIITCNNYYVWNDNKRFVAVKGLTMVFDYPFEFEFEGKKTMHLTKTLLVK